MKIKLFLTCPECGKKISIYAIKDVPYRHVCPDCKGDFEITSRIRLVPLKYIAVFSFAALTISAFTLVANFFPELDVPLSAFGAVVLTITLVSVFVAVIYLLRVNLAVITRRS